MNIKIRVYYDRYDPYRLSLTICKGTRKGKRYNISVDELKSIIDAYTIKCSHRYYSKETDPFDGKRIKKDFKEKLEPYAVEDVESSSSSENAFCFG